MKQQKRTVVIGAGLAGLSAAYYGGKHFHLYEAEGEVGGECRTDYVKGYAFDKAGHLLHLRNGMIKRLIKKLMPDVFHDVKRDARICLMNSEMRYPFQANTFGLPPEVKAQALYDYLDTATQEHKPPKHFEDWARQCFGDTIADLFFVPYNEKLWTIPPSQLTLEWMGRFVPKPDVARVVEGAFSELTDGGGYNASFQYPKKGGIDVIAKKIAEHVHNLDLHHRLIAIDVKKKIVTFSNGIQRGWDELVVSLPLPAIAAALDNPPKTVLTAMKKLKWNSVMVVNLGVKRKNIHPGHWLYFPEKKYSFYRVGFPSNFGATAPKGCSSLYAEVALEAGTGWEKRKSIAQTVRRDLIQSGLLATSDKIDVEQLQYIPYGYVIFDKAYHQARKTILDYLNRNAIHCIGRWGNWEYSAMEDALLAGKEMAGKIKRGSA